MTPALFAPFLARFSPHYSAVYCRPAPPSLPPPLSPSIPFSASPEAATSLLAASLLAAGAALAAAHTEEAGQRTSRMQSVREFDNADTAMPEHLGGQCFGGGIRAAAFC